MPAGVPEREQTTAAYAKMALRHLARRYQALDTEIAQLEAEIRRLCAKANPALLAAKGVGPDTAAALLVAAGDNPKRMQSEKSFAALCGHQPRPGVIRPDHPASSQPGRQPASQQRALADRYHPDAHRRRHQRLRHPTQGRRQEEKGDHPLPQAAHRPTDLPTADQPAPNPELRPATHPTPTRRHHRDPGRPSSQHPPQPHLSTRTRPTPQPPPRYQIPELAPNPPSRPIPDLTNIGASNCRVLTHGDLDAWPVDWAEFVDEPDSLVFGETVYEPRPYQQDAVAKIVEGFAEGRRGKLILPCGTGKSVVALWAAERLVGEGGRVLYVVPSISLLGQTMREWATQRRTLQRYIGVCSDSSAARRSSEDANLTELSIPVTTDPEAVADALGQDAAGVMTVVFCTYQSLPVIAKAQDRGAEPFDLMICDEAHRTTGVEKKGRDTVSVWLSAHNDEAVLAYRRLYMTATPRLYSANVREKAQERQVAVYSMDDEGTYGPMFYQMSFRKAVEEGHLSDYEVAIVAVSDGLYANLAGDFIAEHKETGVNVRDVVKLLGLLGCSRGSDQPRDRAGG